VLVWDVRALAGNHYDEVVRLASASAANCSGAANAISPFPAQAQTIIPQRCDDDG